MTAFRAPAGYYPATGYRSGEGGGAVTSSTEGGWHWSSSTDVATRTLAYDLRAHEADVRVSQENWRARAFSVRCLQAFTSQFLGERNRRSQQEQRPLADYALPEGGIFLGESAMSTDARSKDRGQASFCLDYVLPGGGSPQGNSLA